MAKGDVYQLADATVAAAAFLSMEPATTTEVVIHNITVNPTSEASTTALEYFDGTDSYTVDTITGTGSWMGMFLHCRNNATDGGGYYRVNPTDATNTKICCDGVYTK